MKDNEFVTLKQAQEWATQYMGRQVTLNNISYLIQYAKIFRYDEHGEIKNKATGATRVSLEELRKYYDNILKREKKWKEHLGSDVSWELAFDNISESERTKHVHRLHPYKGKFIPQLAGYFLDDHKNRFKTQSFFQKGDIILDPFVGSGTTLVQCKELGLNSIGIDISEFNCWLTQVKVQDYDIDMLRLDVSKALRSTERFSKSAFSDEQEESIHRHLSAINPKYFPNPEYKILIMTLRKREREIIKRIEEISDAKKTDATKASRNRKISNLKKGLIKELEEEVNSFITHCNIDIDFRFGQENERKLVNAFTKSYSELVLDKLDHRIGSLPIAGQQLLIPEDDDDTINNSPLSSSAFLSKWFAKRQLREISHYLTQIHAEDDSSIRNVMKIILSRTVRSCRATKHVDLATLIEPQTKPYYCTKHYKICKPIPTIITHLKRYTTGTIARIEAFSDLRKNVYSEVINADSTKVNIIERIKKQNREFYKLLIKKKIDGAFTSPPYLGLIDYHEQHAYAYELFDIERKDELEIGRMSNGVGQKAQRDYIQGISSVLVNIKKYLKKNAHIFIVANDRYGLYPTIAEKSKLEIVNEFKRPVLNRTERDKQPYSESIFHMIPSDNRL